MITASKIQTDIESLPQQEYIKLMQWLSEYDCHAWDKELAKDSQTGHLDFLIDEALHEKNTNQLKTI